MKVVLSTVVFAIAGVANAIVQLTNSDYSGIEAGKTFKITWSEATGPVTLTLKDGPRGNLHDVETITAGATGNSFVWSVDPALRDGEYAIEITDGKDFNYSPQFDVAGGVPASTSSSATVSITSSSASSTSTSSTETTISSTSSTSSSTSSESSTTSSAESTTTESSSSSTKTSATKTSSSPTSTTSEPAETTTPPRNNDAYGIAAPIIPGVLAALGAALL